MEGHYENNYAKWTAAEHKKVDSMFLRVETVRTNAKEVCAMQVYK